MDGLFNHNRDFNEALHGNIVSLRESQNLFDDLIDETGETEILIAAEVRIKSDVSAGIIPRGFHYSTAIEYPFTTEPFMASRFGDGTYAVWYGSIDLDTTIHETAWHMKNELLGIDGFSEEVGRERAVYLVDCRSVLLDLTGKTSEFPDLTDDDYSFCQQVGHRVQKEGHPGLLAPSARITNGINAVIFRENALNNPRIHCYLTYYFDSTRSLMRIERTPGETYLSIEY